MRVLLDKLIPSRRRTARARSEETRLRDERSDKMLADLQRRREVAEETLRDRQRRNHWQESISQMIREGRA